MSSADPRLGIPYLHLLLLERASCVRSRMAERHREYQVFTGSHTQIFRSFDQQSQCHQELLQNTFGFHPSTVRLSPHVALDDHFAESLSFQTELSATPDVTSDLNTALKLLVG
jgi:hypothetical protein